MKRDDPSKKDKIISCAECRRLKLKCDRQFPCSSCRRRGLAALCPESSLVTRPRKNPQLSKKGTTVAAKMSERIKQLEEALTTLQVKYSEEPHPLLLDDDSTEDEDEGTKLEESIGTLAIDPESGTTSFYGHSAGMESYYHHELCDLPKRALGEDGQPAETFDAIKDLVLYPLFINVPQSAIREHLDAYLPSHEEAFRLRDIYYDNAAWMYSSMTREVVQGIIFYPVYTVTVPTVKDPSYSLTNAATLFMAFAVASCLDLRNSSTEDTYQNAARYYQLARAALTGERSMLEKPSLPAIRVLLLMVFYHMLLDENKTPEIMWSLLSLATGIAVNMGLHRSSRAWNLPPTVVQERRSLLWQIVRFNAFQGEEGWPSEDHRRCLGTLLIAKSIQTILYSSQTDESDRYRIELMASTILPEFAEFVLSSSKHKYSDVILMDRKLRDCSEDVFGSPVGSLNFVVDDLKFGNAMCNFYILAAKEALVIYLHRNYFVRVCSNPSPDYLRITRYAPSFFATLRSAQVIIKLLGFLLELEPDMPCRFWVFWTHALASAIIVGSVVIQHPRCVLGQEAMESMEAIYSQLCQWAGRDTLYDRPKRALKTVAQLREKALRALETGVVSTSLSTNSGEDGVSLGLSLLAGSSRVVHPSNAKASTAAVTSATPSSTTSSDSPPGAAPVGELHPTLLEDMNSVLGRDWESKFPFYTTRNKNNDDVDMSFLRKSTPSANVNASASASVSSASPPNATGSDPLTGFKSPNPQDMYQTLMDFQNLDNASSVIGPSSSHRMYQNQASNQVSGSEFGIGNLRQQQQQSQRETQSQLQPQTALSAEMLTNPTSYYGYSLPMQPHQTHQVQDQTQAQAQAQAQAAVLPSWPDMMQGLGYQTEENYPLVDDDGVWQNLVAGLGIFT